MKLLAAALLFAFVAVVIADDPPPPPPSGSPPPPPPRPKGCHKQEDCDEDECCLMQFFSGLCRPRGKQNDRCSSKELTIMGKYIIQCPCEGGLTCEPEEVKEMKGGMKILINERCVAGGTEVEEDTTAAPEEPESE